MKRGLIFSVILVAAMSGFFWWKWVISPPELDFTGEKEVFFVIKKGEGLEEIASRLKEKGLIRDPFVFKLSVLTKDLSRKIQAGSFRLHPGMSLDELVVQLTHGTLDVWVTLLEGWRSEQFAEELVNKGFDINLENWDSEVKNLGYEGYLFPDTYLFPRGTNQETLFKIMRNNFEEKTGFLEKGLAEKGLTFRQVIILASMVEREMKSVQDKPVVAGILIKRWKNSWPLQIDATVQYAVASAQLTTYSGFTENPRLKDRDNSQLKDWWPKSLTKKDLQIDSPYNTYKYQGLPPGPICNPGLQSIEAVVNYQDSPYWFYLSDSKGLTHFGATLEEHYRNIDAFLR